MSKAWEESDSTASFGMEVEEDDDLNNGDLGGELRGRSEKEERRYQRRRADEESLPVKGDGVSSDGVGVERRVHRALVLVIDMSRTMAEKDYSPSRIELVLKTTRDFINEYFEQSPISLLSLVVMRNSVASIKTPCTSDRVALERGLQDLIDNESNGARTCAGEMSLQNGLRVARDSLAQVKSVQAAAEILIIFGGTTSCDPGNISAAIDILAGEGVVCNTLSLSAEIYIAKKIAVKTGGLSLVALNERHFRDIFFRFTKPSPVFNVIPPHTIEIGFPEHKYERLPTFCFCCKEFTAEGYYCPRCGGKCCHIPSSCPICGLFLLASYHLAKSYHHLFSLPQYNETPVSVRAQGTSCTCYGCSMKIASPAWQCSSCHQNFCGECEIYIHETLFNCPGCMELKK